MSSRPKKISSKGVSNKKKTSINQNLEALEKIVFINVKSNLDENDDAAKRSADKEPLKFHGNIFKLIPLLRRECKYKTQKETFNTSMKYLIIVAQISGLFPLFSFKGENVPKERWPMLSWRYVFSIFMSISQLLAAILCFRIIVSGSVTINNFAYFSFYVTTFVSSISFLRLSTKWNYLMKQLETAELDEYIDPSIGYKCNFAAIVIVGLAIVEHAMSLAVKFTAAEMCVSNSTDALKPFLTRNYYWIYSLHIVPHTKGFGIYLAVKKFLITIVWNYLHLFVICISLYLTSILTQINKVIISLEGQYLSPSYWRKLRVDYNRASRLVRCFDDAINSIVLISFATNMYFSCLRLYVILLHGFQLQPCSYYYPNSNEKNFPGLLHGYLSIAFSLYSLTFVLLRSLAVALIAAKIHSASVEVAPVLYSVPSPTFCTEIQRFIEQLHGNTVALTGLNFFFVTKELILTIVGTIVTYELVLLQFVKG